MGICPQWCVLPVLGKRITVPFFLAAHHTLKIVWLHHQESQDAYTTDVLLDCHCFSDCCSACSSTTHGQPRQNSGGCYVRATSKLGCRAAELDALLGQLPGNTLLR